MKAKNGKILVAMSGGIDSSVSALLLKERGFDVRGIHFIFQKEINSASKAREIAHGIGIPLLVEDVSEKFKKEVVGYFISEYKKNRTPNPCVVCNPKLKFDSLLKSAEKSKIEFVATGHYSCIEKAKDKANLLKAKDKKKDQSYFLYGLEQDTLRRIIFPLCDSKKQEVVKIAKKHNLPCSENESQDVCFFRQDESLKSFLEKKVGKKTGKIVDEEGNILGNHDGYIFYTIGQRHGLGLGGGPFYVIKKRPNLNFLVVTKDKKNSSLWSDRIRINKTNWIAGKPKNGKRYKIRTRYQAKSISGKITRDQVNKSNWFVKLEQPAWAVAPGQSLVVYDLERVLGGGIIKKAGHSGIDQPRQTEL